MPRFRRGFGNIIYNPAVAERMGRSVSRRLRARSEDGLAVGRPRRGEREEGEGYLRWAGGVRRSSRRYAGLSAEGEQILIGRAEGMTLKELSALTGWPVSTIHDFLARHKEALP